MITLAQMDLQGNPISEGLPGQGLPSPSKLAVMAATGADLRLLLVILIAMELPFSGLLHAAGC